MYTYKYMCIFKFKFNGALSQAVFSELAPKTND